MAEILTESFCERCGTRYTFESPARRSSPLGALGTVGRGIRNFVVSPDQTIDEAWAVAKAETEHRATAHQLEAFHQTFNFCLSCRQYTCGNCWNPVEGRCQSCAPIPGAEDLPAADLEADSAVVAEAMAIARAAAVPVIDSARMSPAGDAEAGAGIEAAEPESGLEAADAAEMPDEPATADEPDVSIPEVDLAARLASVSSRLDEPVAEPIDEEPALPTAEAASEPEAVVESVVEAVPDAVAEPEPEAIAEPEPEAMAEPEPEALAEPVATPESAPEPAALAEPEPSSGAPAQPASALQFPPGVSLDEEIAAYDLRVAALAMPPAEPAPMSEPPTPARPPAVTPSNAPAELVWPMAAERSAAPRAAAPGPLPDGAPRPAPRYVPGIVPDLPAASPVALPAAQSSGSCAACGLSLSATARFCRRCGTAQHVA